MKTTTQKLRAMLNVNGIRWRDGGIVIHRASGEVDDICTEILFEDYRTARATESLDGSITVTGLNVYQVVAAALGKKASWMKENVE